MHGSVEAYLHFRQSMNMNTVGGKCNRGISVPDSVSILLGKALTEGGVLPSSNSLEWMTELLQAFFLVADDIMDSSITRRGQPFSTPEQRQIMEENYGHKDKTKEAIIKKLCNDLNLDRLYKDYEEKRVGEIPWSALRDR
jgi:geranylgeranyl pyrophosphate synthase